MHAAWSCAALAVLSLVGSATASAGLRPPPLDVYKGTLAAAAWQGANSYQAKCELHWRNTTLDHFDWVWGAVSKSCAACLPA